VNLEPWLETIGVCLVAVCGVLAGKWFSTFRKPYCCIGWILAFLLISILILVRYSLEMRFVQPFFLLTAGRTKFIILCLAATIGMTSAVVHLSNRIARLSVAMIMGFIIGVFCIQPFLSSALIEQELAGLKSRFDSDGICIQTTDFTCGPAAAVTALREFGIEASEGELAVLAHSTPIAGTFPGSLYSALKNRYGNEGLHFQYRQFQSLDQLKNAGITLAVVKDVLFSDHCVAVLSVTDRAVIIADPSFGKMMLSPAQFEKIWRHCGIALKRQYTQNI